LVETEARSVGFSGQVAVMRPPRAIVYGIGAMGALMTRLMLDKGIEIVGAVARSPAKVGRDLGEVAALGRSIGVLVEGDARPVLARGADIAVVCVGSYLETMHDHFALCLEHGVNVVTLEEETVFPWTTAAAPAAALDRLAKANGVTLAASGAQDVFWLNLIATVLGAAHRIDAVIGRCRWNVDDYGAEVAAHLHVGQSAAAFARHLADAGWPEFVARQTLEALIARLGLSVSTIASSVEPILATAPVHCRSLGEMVPEGHLIGTVDRTEIATCEGPRFTLAMEGRLYRDGEADRNDWRIAGEPALDLRNDSVPYRFVTCSTLVNRIPDVIGAEPGLLSLDRLGPPSYRHGWRTAQSS
jgi:4-hydroxy-tetrahydrodipicolinate reductase